MKVIQELQLLSFHVNPSISMTTEKTPPLKTVWCGWKLKLMLLTIAPLYWRATMVYCTAVVVQALLLPRCTFVSLNTGVQIWQQASIWKYTIPTGNAPPAEAVVLCSRSAVLDLNSFCQIQGNLFPVVWKGAVAPIQSVQLGCCMFGDALHV